MGEPTLLTLEEAAKRLGMSQRKLDGLIARGDLARGFELDGSVRIESTECDRWLAAHRPPTGTAE